MMLQTLKEMMSPEWIVYPLNFLFTWYLLFTQSLSITSIYAICGKSMVRLKVGVYIWQNKFSVVWVWFLDRYLPHPLGYTGLANFSWFLGKYIPSVVYNFQEQ